MVYIFRQKIYELITEYHVFWIFLISLVYFLFNLNIEGLSFVYIRDIMFIFHSLFVFNI